MKYIKILTEYSLFEVLIETSVTSHLSSKVYLENKVEQRNYFQKTPKTYLPNVLIILDGKFPKTFHKLPYLLKQNKPKSFSLLMISIINYCTVQ